MQTSQAAETRELERFDSAPRAAAGADGINGAGDEHISQTNDCGLFAKVHVLQIHVFLQHRHTDWAEASSEKQVGH